MRTVYFDCFSGISGDMIIAAFLDAGFSISELKKELERLKIKNYNIISKKVKRGHGIYGTNVDIKINGKETFTPTDMRTIIENSALSNTIKNRAVKILTALVNAESKIHRLPLSKIHFHEMSAVDTIIDIAGSLIAIDKMKVGKIYCSPINTGGPGTVKTDCGIFPVPSPAAVELLKGLPVYSNGEQMELTTPTGAAIISEIADIFSPMPLMKVEKTGYGAGKKEIEGNPNFLRIFLGETKSNPYQEDTVAVIETNIDDSTPQVFDGLMQKLFKSGALDVYISFIMMKKNRPAFKLSVISNIRDIEKMADLIFRETTTFGIRISYMNRLKLHRKAFNVKTKWGRVRVNAGIKYNEILKIIPEYDD